MVSYLFYLSMMIANDTSYRQQRNAQVNCNQGGFMVRLHVRSLSYHRPYYFIQSSKDFIN